MESSPFSPLLFPYLSMILLFCMSTLTFPARPRPNAILHGLLQSSYSIWVHLTFCFSFLSSVHFFLCSVSAHILAPQLYLLHVFLVHKDIVKLVKLINLVKIYPHKTYDQSFMEWKTDLPMNPALATYWLRSFIHGA